MKTNTKWFQELEASAEAIGARVFLIENCIVDYTRPYDEVILKVGRPLSPSYKILEIANKYQPSERGIIKETVILFYYSDWMKMTNASYSEAINWGLSNSLRKTTLHVPFALVEQNPNLCWELNMRHLVATAGFIDLCWFACYERFTLSQHGASLFCQYQSGLRGSSFAFCK